MTKKYSIGLDIGTNSVGWAVIDENNELVRYKKKNMWGSRLFDEANPAAGRRVNRSARRRLKRRAQRINFLRQLLAPMVLPVDDGFFMKLNESILWLEDKTKSPLEASLKDAGYLEKTKAAPKKYPTIYHLRKALMESDEKFDPRLIYVAIHHIIKYRGNFLYPGQEFKLEDTQKIGENLSHVFEYMEEQLGFDFAELEGQRNQIIAHLKNNQLSRSARRSEIQQLFDFKGQQKTCFANILGAFLGFKIDAHKIFTDLDETKIEFAKFEEKRDDWSEKLGERIEFFDLLQSVYSWVVLQNMLRGEASISQAMINKYDDYARDLKFIKALFKKYLSTDEYKEFFKAKEGAKNQHLHYTKYSESGWNYDEFIKDFKKYYEKAVKNGADITTTEATRFAERLENREAFAKLRMSDNGAIPYQLHKDELVKIIEKQGQFYPELLEAVDNGDGQQKYKLVRLIEYRVPYYVGPLQTSDKNKSEFAWMKRKENGDITPFNFYQKVDKLGSAEAFITNLTNNCTYLPDKPVLPKHSLLMSEFTVRNEIKNMRFDGEPVSIDFENSLFRDVFLCKKKVTTKDVVNYLQTSHHAVMLKKSHPEITGLSDKNGFHSSMGAYIDFTQKIGVNIELETSDPTYQMVENLIKWVTIFEDKAILKEKIALEYGDQLGDEQIEQIANLNYTGWGSLSRELLTEIKSHPHGSAYSQSIIELMRNEPANFMQIISNEAFGIKSKLTAALEEFMADEEKTDYDLVRDLPASPSVKRGIWQAVKLVKEIVELQGGQKPEKIYIEMARGSNGSDQTVKRKRAIEKLYDKVEIHAAYATKEELKQLKSELKEFEKIDKRAWELYFRQLGKCAYSGKPINPGEISQTCQIDHIIPRSLVKDDSIDNKVLVLSAENQRKRESYPLDPEVVKHQVALWRYWRENGLMSPAKFARLTQTQEKYDKDMVSGGFIKRQLVETRQITKHVAGLFDRIYASDNGKSIVEPVKARITSEFRDKFDFPKSRSINDFHHAKDAYLAAVLGRYLAAKFDTRKRSVLYERYMSFRKNELIHQSEREQREARERGFVLWGIDKKENLNKETGEITDGEQRIKTIRRTMRFNDCLVTKKLIEQKSGFYKITPQKKDKNLSPLKAKLPPEKYGGYTGVERAYYVAVRYMKRQKPASAIVGISIEDSYLIRDSKINIESVVQKNLGDDAKDVRIVKDKILKYQLIDKDGALVRMVSDKEVINGKQFRMPFEMESIFAFLEKRHDEKTYNRYFIDKLGELIDKKLSIDDKKIIDEEIHSCLNKIFDYYTKTLESEFKIFHNELEKIFSKKSDFVSLTISDKIKNLSKLFKLTRENSENPAFGNEFDLGKRFGRKSGQTFDLDKIKFYDCSITGLKLKKKKL
ncbi:MAG: type II CRISPR RNA-guided endonuclease Cas9 [Candidatus Saccharibacteria bacterium]|nr:type II CRISPR RNA-guided endonuclease Cas9 [Candidatus Saccharibacteria bacterium]